MTLETRAKSATLRKRKTGAKGKASNAKTAEGDQPVFAWPKVRPKVPDDEYRRKSLAHEPTVHCLAARAMKHVNAATRNTRSSSPRAHRTTKYL